MSSSRKKNQKNKRDRTSIGSPSSPLSPTSPSIFSTPTKKIEKDFTLPDDFIVIDSVNQFIGVGVHEKVMKKLNIFPSSLVIVFPSILYESNPPKPLPYIVAPIFVSQNCKFTEIEMEENYRETLSLGFGETVKIIEYAPSPVTKQITLNLITENQKVEQKSVEILVKPVLRADKIEIVPENTTHFPIEDQENIKRNLKFSLFPLRFLFQNFVFSALFFNEKFKFQIRAIFSAVNSDECTASLHSHAIQAFLINENSFIRYLPSPDPSLSPSHANLSLPNHKLIIGGLSDSLRLINHQIKLCFDHSHHWSNFNIKLPRGILLYGPPGTGKTLLIKKIAEDNYPCELFIINSSDIIGKVYGESENKLREIFYSALRRNPKNRSEAGPSSSSDPLSSSLVEKSIIFIDEIDILSSKRENLHSQFEKRIVSELIHLFDQIHSSSSLFNSSVVVIAATNRIQSIDPALRRPGRFDREIEIGIPTTEQRKEILGAYFEQMKHNLSEEEIQKVSEITHGYVGADLASLCRETCIKALARHQILQNTLLVQSSEKQEEIFAHFHSSSQEGEQQGGKETIIIRYEDLSEAFKTITPSAMRELSIEVPKITWEDIGGNFLIKQQLKEAVEWPLLYPDAFKRMGIRPPRGILLYGPPGCSKTMMAKALATESSLNFIAVKGPELFSKWVGESERAVRELFRKAKLASPAIIFFDEIDALAIKRGGSDAGGVADRVLSQLLTELDGVEPLKKVTVVAATNRPDLLDKALLRPGRIDRIIYVGPPDASAREQIFKLHLQKVPADDSVLISSLIQLSEGYSGAEVVAVCREASMNALEENIQTEQLSMTHFQKAFDKIKPRITKETLAFYERFQNQKV